MRSNRSLGGAGGRKDASGVLAAVIAFAVVHALAAPAGAADGTFDRAWGKDVAISGPGNTGTGFEICVAAVDTCKAGVAGALGGETDNPTGVATDSAGNVYVADRVNARVQRFDSSGNFERAWGKDVASAGPGNTGTGFEICVAAVDTCKAGVAGALGGEMDNPAGVATDSAGDVYVADQFNHRIQRFDSSGSFERAWGKDVVSAGPGNNGTGFEICVAAVDTCKAGFFFNALGGEMEWPDGVATDSSGKVYVADEFNHRIQRFDSSGSFERAWGKDVVAAGPGDTGVGFEVCIAGVDFCRKGRPDGGAGGEMSFPAGVATDSGGKIYVSDLRGNRVQRFDSSGSFQRAWGKDVVAAGPGDTGTGFEVCIAGIGNCKAGVAGALGGEMEFPLGIATDSAGDVYVADYLNHRIQRFDSLGSFERAWGKDVASAGPGDTGTGFEICVAAVDTCKVGVGVGDGLGGEMSFPFGVATDSAGSLYVADNENSRIQKFADPAAPPPPDGGPVPDTIAPETSIDRTKVKESKAKFRFSSSESGSRFECRLDRRSFKPCESPKKYKKLDDGKHRFRVRAIDPAGNVDGSPARVKFKISG